MLALWFFEPPLPPPKKEENLKTGLISFYVEQQLFEIEHNSSFL